MIDCIYTELPSFVKIGKYTSIAKDCRFMGAHEEHLWSSNNECVFTTNWGQKNLVNYINIGNDVWIGEGVCILSGVTIGDGAIIGTRTVVSKDVPPYAVVVGNPQMIKKFRFNQEQIDKLRQMEWWNWQDNIIEERKKDMTDITNFISKYG